MSKKSKSAETDYEIGYRKPPKATQFKKGKSGNPKGRPKESVRFGSLLEEALNEKVELRDGDRVKRMTMAEVMIRNLLARCAKNDQRACSAVFRFMKEMGLLRPPEQEPRQGRMVAFPIPMPSPLLQALADEYEYPTDHTAPDYLDMDR